MSDIPELRIIRRHDVHDYLPLDEKGRLSRDVLLAQYNINGWDKLPTITAFAGSREGLDPAFQQAAEEFSHMTSARGIGLVTGGAPDKLLGLMSAVADHNPNIIGISPQPFADKNGINTGLSARSINIITYDFYSRKPLMSVMADTFAAFGGGLGTLEEVLEELSIGAKTGKSVHLLNLGGFWSPLMAQLTGLKSLGLIRADSIAQHTFSPNLHIMFGHLENALRNSSSQHPERMGEKIKKTGNSLQSVLRESPHWVPDQIFEFCGKDAPRVGFVATSNISADAEKSHLNNRRLNNEFCEQAKRLGQEFAQAGGVLVLSGDRAGLRQLMADAALANSGKVIWIQKNSHQRDPLMISHFQGEMTLTVTREFEKAMLFDLVSQTYGFLPGGLHTLDRVFEIITREQTGFGGIRSYEYMAVPVDVPERKPVPAIGYNVGGLWTDIQMQIEVFHKNKFIKDEDLQLFQMLDTNQNLGEILVANAKKETRLSYDLLQLISYSAPRRSIQPPVSGTSRPYSRLAR